MPTEATTQPSDLTESDFRRIREVLLQHCGIALNESKRELVRARVAKELRATGLSTVGEYLDRVLADRGEGFTRFIDSLSTNLTSFFREADHFAHLTGTFLPPLLRARAAAGDRRLIAWSAACSSGEEAYTMAMVVQACIDTTFGRSSPPWDVRILATDISTRVLERAKLGEYDSGGASRIPAEMRERHLVALPNGRCRVRDELRASIRFRHLNLMDSWPFSGPFDFIFCRNVMIYFDSATQQRLVGRLAECLRPGGLLFTGHSESLTGVAHKMVHRGPSIYQRP
jgi:chemotaxis protein methyltransferase CheR